MTKLIFILSFISRGLEFWLVNHTSIEENSESNISKKINSSGEITNDWPNDLGTNIYKTLEFCW